MYAIYQFNRSVLLGLGLYQALIIVVYKETTKPVIWMYRLFLDMTLTLFKIVSRKTKCVHDIIQYTIHLKIIKTYAA
jgi:hypothetical protein